MHSNFQMDISLPWIDAVSLCCSFLIVPSVYSSVYFVLCFVYRCCQCLSVVHSCLSSSCVLCMVVSNTYSVVLFVLFVVVLCLVYGCVQHIYCCVICLVCRRSESCVWLFPTYIMLYYFSCLSSSVSCVWLCPTHIVLCYLSCLSSSCVLCMVVSNTYSVVLFVLFVVGQNLVYGCVQHI